MSASLTELFALWHGDLYSCGYIHEEIVVAVCDRIHPTSAEAVRLRFYPGLAEKQVDEDAMATIRCGFELWRTRTGRE